MITENSTLKDVYNTPIGYDIISKLLMSLNIKENIIENILVSKLKLKYLSMFAGRDLIDSLIELVNLERDEITDNGKINKKWWKEAVFYQIYPKSFCDLDNDGIGDIQGIISKLDYLKDLGIDCLWLSPIYDSPNDDNGYDIRDYKKIMAEMGTMNDFDELLDKCHQKGLKLIMDLVVNHTSDEHEWYKKALAGDKKYQDYYFFRDKPNNWKSFFGGSAWKYEEKLNKYVLHTFSSKQMDLNWDNPNVRQEVIDLVRFYHQKGVDGFRLDVINFISKKAGLPDGSKKIGEIMQYTGIEHYYYGPNLNKYLKELKNKAFKEYNAFAVGETPGHGIEMGRFLSNESREELDLVFSFEHLETPGNVRFKDYQYDLNYLKKLIYKYNRKLTSQDWQALYLENHDNPRMVSKVNKNIKYRDVLSKMLMGLLLSVKGTPFIFQGQELGSLNLNFNDISEIKDIESINKYHELVKEGKSKEEAFRIILSGSRDHARGMINWDDTVHHNAWIKDYTLNDGYSVADQLNNLNSPLSFFKEMAKFRKSNIDLVYADLIPLDNNLDDVMIFKRGKFTIEINLSERTLKRNVLNKDVLLSNYKNQTDKLQPYEFTIYK